MCDKTVDVCLAALKFVPDWFVISKMIKKLFTDLYADKNILYFDEDFGNFLFNCNEMGIFNTDLNCINLNDNHFDEDILVLLFMSEFCFGILNLKNTKQLKKL